MSRIWWYSSTTNTCIHLLKLEKHFPLSRNGAKISFYVVISVYSEKQHLATTFNTGSFPSSVNPGLWTIDSTRCMMGPCMADDVAEISPGFGLFARRFDRLT
jgi:hypothetical protein